MQYDPKKQYQVLVYESVTYIYNVPPGVDPEDYREKVLSGDVDADEKDSHVQGDEVWEVR